MPSAKLRIFFAITKQTTQDKKMGYEISMQNRLIINKVRNMNRWFYSLCTRWPILLGARVQPSITKGQHPWSVHKGNLWRLQQHTQQIDLMDYNVATSHEHHDVSNHRQLHCLYQRPVQTNNRENIKTQHYWPFVTAIHRRPENAPCKGWVMRNVLPYHAVIMKSFLFVCLKSNPNFNEAFRLL